MTDYSKEAQKVIDHLKESGYDTEEYDAESVGDQGEHDDHGGGGDGVSGAEPSKAEVAD